MIRLLAIVALSLSLIGCGDDVSPTAATTPTPDTKAPLRVLLDLGTCIPAGHVIVGQAAASIDGVSLGTLRPGDGGLTRDVPIGVHTVTASGGGRIWPATIVDVRAGGSVYVLYC